MEEMEGAESVGRVGNRGIKGCRPRTARTTETQVSGTDKSNTDPGIEVATDGAIGATKFLSKLGSEKLQEGGGFLSKKAISRGNERNKITPVVLEGNRVLAILGLAFSRSLRTVAAGLRW